MYGKELILDLYACDSSKFNRVEIEKFLIALCELIDMEREDLHWWDFEGNLKDYDVAPEHLKGTSAIQFISTSDIVIHTLDDLGRIYFNIFSCKDYDADEVIEFTEEWFDGEANSYHVIDRHDSTKVEITETKGHKFMWINDHLWTCDTKPEVAAQRALASQAFGNVLVVGYGLGVVQKNLIKNNMVDSVTTIESHTGVLAANRAINNTLSGTVNVGDFFIDDLPKYDCVIGDMVDDIQPKNLPEYMRFKKRALGLINKEGKILHWGSDYFEHLLTKESK